MLKAEHKKWARLIFNPYLNRLLRNNFTSFSLVNDFPEIPEDRPLIIAPNHISWWDGFFIDYVIQKLSCRQMHIMMLESSLKKYWFFKKLGAYSVDLSNNISIKETIKYSRDVLEDNKNLLIVYPQGEIELFEEQHKKIKEGIKLLITSGDEIILPVGFKIQYYNEKYPTVICRFGNLLSGMEIKNNFEIFITSFEDNLKELQKHAVQKKFRKDLFSL